MDLRGCELASLRKNEKVIEEIERNHGEKEREEEEEENNNNDDNDQIVKPTVATNTLSPVIEEVITDETLVITDKNTHFHKSTTTNSPIPLLLAPGKSEVFELNCDPDL